MNKKQYFLFLLLISSMGVIFSLIDRIVESASIGQKTFSISNLLSVFAFFAYNVIAVFLGIYCAKKAGFRLFLLEDRVNIFEDIVKPAFCVGIPFVCVWLIMNWSTFIPLTKGLLNNRSLSFFKHSLLNHIRTDLFCLFGVALIALVMKKVIKNVSNFVVMTFSIGLILLCVNMPKFFDYFVLSRSFRMTMSDLSAYVGLILLSVLFWKKGLEAAMMYSFVVNSILYLVVPAFVFVLGM